MEDQLNVSVRRPFYLPWTCAGEAVVEKIKISGHSLAVRWSPGKDASLPPV